MKTLEYNHGGNWFDRLNNALAVDVDIVRTAAFAVDEQGWYFPGTRSLFYNGYVMVRAVWPLGVWLHVKWRPDARLQLGVGWKLNGRFGIVCRYEPDAAAAAGTHGPNVGQASGFARGTA